MWDNVSLYVLDCPGTQDLLDPDSRIKDDRCMQSYLEIDFDYEHIIEMKPVNKQRAL